MTVLGLIMHQMLLGPRATPTVWESLHGTSTQCYRRIDSITGCRRKHDNSTQLNEHLRTQV